MLFGRVLIKRPEKSLLLTGLRGVGKTVLLGEIERIGQAAGYRSILVEAHEGKPLAALLAPHLRRLLFDLDRVMGAGDKARRGLSALIMAMHKMQQRQWPLVLIGAGLPILPGLAGESKSYAERLFSFPPVGPLPEADANRALQDPMIEAGEAFEPAALHEIFRLTQGYPYFLQEWGYQAWNHAAASPIGLQVVQQSSDRVSRRLDENFFRVRFDRLTPREKTYLRAMAELGPGPYRTGDIADKLAIKINTLGPVRASLIKKGMVYSPSHGEMAFTVPLFDEFMRRAIPIFQP